MMGANNPPISIVLHAGAGESYRGDTESIPEFLRLLAADASERLLSGQSALEVVVYATSVLEDHPRFNAGKGASLNVEGKHEVMRRPHAMFNHSY
jgi:beta-aspartyl-peptidase (threonine type)